HVHARREVPEGAVLHHRCPRARLERARPERVPPHSDGQATHAVCRRRARGARAAAVAREPRWSARRRADAAEEALADGARAIGVALAALAEVALRRARTA